MNDDTRLDELQYFDDAIREYINEHGIPAFFDRIGLDDIGNAANRTEDPLGEVYELLEDMTPPEVRLARQLLGQMHQLWEGIVSHEERLLRIEDSDAVTLKILKRMSIIEGALEELIDRVEELRGKAPKKHIVQPALRMRGVYCRNCAKPLTGRQKVFCTRKCAAVWHGQHQGEIATPRLEINEKPEAVVEAGVGVVKGSVSENGKKVEEVAAV